MDTVDFKNIKLGDTRRLTHMITAKDIQVFSELTGDHNPLHLDKDFAKKAHFRGPVVYGMLSASFLSTMIGMLLPGPGALWLSQTLEFLKEVYEGDTLTVVGKVKHISPSTRILTLETYVYNQKKEDVIKGEAKVKLMELKKENAKMNEQNNSMNVLVTGASRGIGAAIVRKLAEEGHTLIINYLKGEQEASQLVNEIKANGGSAIAIKANISNEYEIKNMINKASEVCGPILGFVHNASLPVNVKLFSDLPWEAVQDHIDVQVKGAYLCMKALLPAMVSAGNGSVVMIGSIAADSAPASQQTGYVIAKSALCALARSIAVEYGPKNIRVNIVSPGMTETDMLSEFPERTKEVTRMQTPLRRLGKPEDIANTVSFLMKPEAKHITGENIRVCGGSVML